MRGAKLTTARIAARPKASLILDDVQPKTVAKYDAMLSLFNTLLG